MGYNRLIIGITGNSMEEELDYFVSSGADCVITKQMKPNVLDRILSLTTNHDYEAPPGKKLVVHGDLIAWVDAQDLKNAL